MVAVAVEELNGGNGIRVVVAINRCAPDSGQAVLGSVKKGLEEVLGLLMKGGKGLYLPTYLPSYLYNVPSEQECLPFNPV